MSTAIEAVLDQYVAITSGQIRDWSRGSVKRRLRTFERAEDWRDVADTLWDQRVFGPVEDWRCACGQFEGMDFSGMQCPICRVTVGLKRARRYRFGHVNLTAPVAHPFIVDAEPLDVVPVIPAVHWESNAGEPLAQAYEELLRLSLIRASIDDLVGAYQVIIAHIDPLFERQVDRDAEEANRLARGMALTPPPYVPEADEEEEAVEGESAEDDDGSELELADDWTPPREQP